MFTTEFPETLRAIHRALMGVDGWLSSRETEFLALLAACPTADGEILEIGSFRGRSTIALALAARLAPGRSSRLIAIDPLLDDDPLLSAPLATGRARETFFRNLEQAGVSEDIEFHQAYSYEVVQRWNRPLRLLWVDGDHSYRSTKQDFDLFSPFLADGAILALHDVLSPYEGCIRVFTEDVLRCPRFGAVGLCGSIGWAQYWSSRSATPGESRQKERLSERLRRLIPYHCQTAPLRGLSKLRYKWLRARVPHRAIDADQWQHAVGVG